MTGDRRPATAARDIWAMPRGAWTYQGRVAFPLGSSCGSSVAERDHVFIDTFSLHSRFSVRPLNSLSFRTPRRTRIGCIIVGFLPRRVTCPRRGRQWWRRCGSSRRGHERMIEGGGREQVPSGGLTATFGTSRSTDWTPKARVVGYGPQTESSLFVRPATGAYVALRPPHSSSPSKTAFYPV